MDTAESSLSLRDRKALRTQQAIIRATAELTIEAGFAAATIPRIAERADVGARTVSRWFPVKDDILFGDSALHIERARAHFERGAGDTIDRLQAWFDEEGRLGSGVTRSDSELERLKMRAVEHDPELRARYLRIFDEMRDLVARSTARDVGGSHLGLAAQAFAGAVLGMIMAIRDSTSEADEPDALSGDRDRVFAFFRAGLETLRVPGE